MNPCYEYLKFFLKTNKIEYLTDHSIECSKYWKRTNLLLPDIIEMSKKEKDNNIITDSLITIVLFPFGSDLIKKDSNRVIHTCALLDLKDMTTLL